MNRSEIFLAEWPPAARKWLQSRLRRAIVRKGQEVVGVGDPSGDVFLVVEGHFEARILSPRGRRVVLFNLYPGDVFGELETIEKHRHLWGVAACVNSTVARISATDFTQLIDEVPSTLAFFLAHTVRRIRVLTEQYFELVAFTVEARVRAELVRLAAGSIERNQARIKNFQTHEQLAAKLGTTREAVTRELNALDRLGYIKQQRGRELLILNCKELALLVSEAL